MIVRNTALQAYGKALQHAQKTTAKLTGQPEGEGPGFADALKGSLQKVNDMQMDKERMIEEFASGKSQNVHELMISMQKAGLAMSMTSAVRSKVMSAYQEIMKMPF